MAKKPQNDDKLDDVLDEAKEAFKLASDSEDDNRKEALEDLRFARLGEQWPRDVRRQREIDGRPCLTLNRLPSFIRQVVNDARQNRPQIKVHPVDSGADVDVSKVFDGLIRGIQYNSKADVAYDTAIEFSVSMGFGYWRVTTDYAHDDSFDMDINIDRVANPFAVYGDPHSTEADSSDWNTSFVIENLTRAEFERKYKGAEAVDWDNLGYARLQPPWADDDHVMVAEWWTRTEITRQILKLAGPNLTPMVVDALKFAPAKDAFAALGYKVVGERPTKSWKVNQKIMTGAEVLEDNPWAGKYIPIVPVYGDEVNVEGKRYFRSMIRDAKDPQRMLNYWRTTSTELVALAPRAPWIGAAGQFDTDSAKWATANTTNHPFIEYDQVGGAPPPQRQPFAGPPAGAIQEALNASDDMKAIMGIFDPSLGERSNETSGRAILARQRQGDRGTFHFADNLSRAITHTGKILIDLIPQVYNEERVVRVIQQDGTQLTASVNQKQADGTVLNDLSVGKYDIVVDSGPSYETRRDEAAAEMLDLLHAFPQAAPAISDLLVKNLDWPGADEIAERLKAMQPNPQAQQQQQQAQQQAELQHQQNLEQIKVQGDQAREQIKVQAVQQIETFKAQKAVEVDQAKQSFQQRQITAQNQIEAAREDRDDANDYRIMMDKTKIDALAKIIVAQITAQRPVAGNDDSLIGQVEAEQ
ncbi:portal protein [Telmatospirillum sp.]|uniref:portal protein n=1 Tax=Telmatospirillum sp. TaxID=2079197 RepID=UPI00284F91E3|nr:portal protein [Telmatospirillum sp.]MDR3439871.1 portal protein [Telmatospirillum sp.]